MRERVRTAEPKWTRSRIQLYAVTRIGVCASIRVLGDTTCSEARTALKESHCRQFYSPAYVYNATSKIISTVLNVTRSPSLFREFNYPAIWCLSCPCSTLAVSALRRPSLRQVHAPGVSLAVSVLTSALPAFGHFETNPTQVHEVGRRRRTFLWAADDERGKVRSNNLAVPCPPLPAYTASVSYYGSLSSLMYAHERAARSRVRLGPRVAGTTVRALFTHL